MSRPKASDAATAPQREFVEFPEAGDDSQVYLEKLVGAEYQRMREEAERWQEPDRGPGDPANPVGLALSGGGIRSATFGLGVLQGLAQGDWLKDVDYLSTVSGGGYIGGSLSWFLGQDPDTAESEDVPRYSTDPNAFPFETEYGLGHSPNGGPVTADPDRVQNLRWLRQHGNYLTPGGGLNMAALVGVAVRTIVPSVVVYLGVLTGLFLVLEWLRHTVLESWLGIRVPNPGFASALAFAGVIVFLAILYTFVAWWSSLMRPSSETKAEDVSSWGEYKNRRRLEIIGGWLVVGALVTLVLGTLPLMVDLVGRVPFLGPDVAGATVGATSLVGGLLMGIRFFQRTVSTISSTKATIPTGVLVTAGAALVSYGLLLLSYWGSTKTEWLPWVIAFVVFAMLLGVLADINLISFHRFYRDRLMETFMPNADFRQRKAGVATEAEHAWLETHGARRPYHLVNTNHVLVRAHTPRYRGRGGDNFILSSEYCGSSATGWAATNAFLRGSLTLPTAVAISGAAANPNAGVGGEGPTRGALAAFLMAFLNIRLGTWVPNPRRYRSALAGWQRYTGVPNFLRPGLNSLFRIAGFHEQSGWVELTDGGHFENLGIYELVRRRCKLIIACDAGADPDFAFADLGNAMERIRADFGVLINLEGKELDRLVPNASDNSAVGPRPAYAERPYLIARICYPIHHVRASGGGTGCTGEGGVFIYLKTTFNDRLAPGDVYAYKAAHRDFPDQTTADQFFDEKQFEAYRELGFLAAHRLIQDMANTGAAVEEKRLTDVEAALVREAVEIVALNTDYRTREMPETNG